jgi:hypothetical protein
MTDTEATVTLPDGGTDDLAELTVKLGGNRNEIEVPANRFAAAWLNVFLAAGEDGAPSLDRAVQIEVHDDRIRLISSDSYTMHAAEVPRSLDDDIGQDLDTGSAPDEVLLVHDFEGRAKALMAWVHSSTKKDEFATVSFWVGSMEDPNQPTLLPALARRGLVLDAGHERVWLPVDESEPFEWRNLFDSDPDPTIEVAFDPEFLARPAKFKNRVGPVVCTHTDGPMVFHVEGNPTVHGLIVPVRLP